MLAAIKVGYKVCIVILSPSLSLLRKTSPYLILSDRWYTHHLGTTWKDT